jgi:hypothetical protein
MAGEVIIQFLQTDESPVSAAPSSPWLIDMVGTETGRTNGSASHCYQSSAQICLCWLEETSSIASAAI